MCRLCLLREEINKDTVDLWAPDPETEVGARILAKIKKEEDEIAAFEDLMMES